MGAVFMATARSSNKQLINIPYETADWNVTLFTKINYHNLEGSELFIPISNELNEPMT